MNRTKKLQYIIIASYILVMISVNISEAFTLDPMINFSLNEVEFTAFNFFSLVFLREFWKANE